MELKDLVGLHELTGIDMRTMVLQDQSNKELVCQAVSFILDGRTYTAVEPPNKFMVSDMRSIFEFKYEVINIFPSCKVNGILNPWNLYDDQVLSLISIETGRTILSVGIEDNSDYYEYYPIWICEYYPENINNK